MATETSPPARSGGLRNIGALVKKNKVPIMLAGGVGGFLLLSRKGSGGDTAQATYGTIVPVMRPLDDTGGGGVGGGGDDLGDLPEPDLPPVDTTDPIPDGPTPTPEDPLPPSAQVPDDPSPTTADTGPVSSVQTPPPAAKTAAAVGPGVTISGTNIPGATSRTASGSGSNQYGKYTDWLVSFPGGSAHYWHYHEDEHGQYKDVLTGPHDPKGTIPAAAKIGRDEPTVFKNNQGNPGYVPPTVPAAKATPPPMNNPQVTTWADFYVWQRDGDVHTYRVFINGPGAVSVHYMQKQGNYGKPPGTLSAALLAKGWQSATPFLADKGPYTQFLGYGEGVV